MNPTLPIATSLRRLLHQRCTYADRAEWLWAVHVVGEQARHEAAKLKSSLDQEVQRLKRNDRTKDRKISPVRFATTQNVIEWAREHNIRVPVREDWWFIIPPTPKYEKGSLELPESPPATAFIHGLDNSRGVPRITNGIDVWIERADGTCFKGHRDYMKWDRHPKSANAEGNVQELNNTPKPRAKSKKRLEWEELLSELAGFESERKV